MQFLARLLFIFILILILILCLCLLLLLILPNPTKCCGCCSTVLLPKTPIVGKVQYLSRSLPWPGTGSGELASGGRFRVSSGKGCAPVYSLVPVQPGRKAAFRVELLKELSRRG